MSVGPTPPLELFQGIMPALIATCSPDGTPNVTYLSQVFRVDDRHVALSRQFFNKTQQNVEQNPFACVELYDPLTLDAYRFDLRFLRSESSGPVFDTMRMRIEAIAAHTGMTGIFRLIAADVYEVLRIEKPADFLLPETPTEASLKPEASGRGLSELACVQAISQVTSRATNLEELLSTTLATLEQTLGFSHSMLLLPDESGSKLFAIASRGYGEEGVGAEVNLGEGLIGAVAAQRCVLRIEGMGTELRYGRSVRRGVEKTAARKELRAEIPLPGIPDAQSHVGLPLVAGERLLGVLCVESPNQLAFSAFDDTFLQIVANQLAVALDCALLRESMSDDKPESLRPARGAEPALGPTRRFRFFGADDCVFVGDDYLIRNVPGRILWKILRAYHDTGRSEFSNRELRLDPWLGLPALRDNLESRIVLLRKRLELKDAGLRLVPTTRGHFRLEVAGPLVLEEIDKAP